MLYERERERDAKVLIIIFLSVFLLGFVSSVGLPDPIMHYVLNDSGGSLINSTYWEDLSGNDYHAVASSPVEWTRTNYSNGYYKFDVTGGDGTGYLAYPGTTFLNTSQMNVTLSFYTEHDPSSPSYLSQMGYLMNESGSAVYSTFYLGEFDCVGLSGRRYLFGGCTGIAYATNTSASDFPRTDNLHHIVLYINQGNVSFYVDGVEYGTEYGGTNPQYLENASYFLFRPSLFWVAPVFVGDNQNIIAEYKIYNETMNETQLIALSNESLIPEGLSLTYPVSNGVVVQRNITTNITTVPVKGTSSNEGEVNITLSGFSSVLVNVSEGEFEYNFTNVPVGIYNVSVSLGDSSDSKNNYGVGDVLLVLGQSNTKQGDELWNFTSEGFPLTSDYPVSIVSANNEDSYVYYENYASESDLDSWLDMGFAPLAYNLSRRENVPVMVLSLGIGARAISCFVEGGNCYGSVVNRTNLFTSGTKGIRTMFWYQGEGDTGTTNYDEYLTNLTNQMFEVFNFEQRYNIVTPVGFATGVTGDPCDQISTTSYAQYADYLISSQNNEVVIGSTTYDIKTTENPNSCIHISNFSVSGLSLGARHLITGLHYLFGEALNRPEISAIYKVNETRIDLVYDRTIKFNYWNGTEVLSTIGLSIYENDSNIRSTPLLNKNNILSSEIINGTIASYNFNESIGHDRRVSYCIQPNECYSEPVIVSSTANSPLNIPVKQLFLQNLSAPSAEYICLYVTGDCHSTSQLTTTEESSGTATYYLFSEQLAEGYSRLMKEKQKVKITINESEKIVEVGSVDVASKSVEVFLGRDNYEISEGEIKKIDTNSDGYYDLEISVSEIQNDEYANLEFKEIYEKIPPELEEERNENVVDSEENISFWNKLGNFFKKIWRRFSFWK